MGRRSAAVVQQFLAILFFCSGAAYANGIIMNGGFGTGNLNGWTPFTTANGTLGIFAPAVVPFDTTGGGVSNAAEFQVGQMTAAGFDPQGGGIFQNVVLSSAGTYSISADIAASNPGPKANGFAGTAELLLDMQPVWGYNLGALSGGEVVRQAITANVIASAGAHSFGIEFLRPATTTAFTPFQYVDNFWVEDQQDAPEPSTFLLLFFGLALLALRGPHIPRKNSPTEYSSTPAPTSNVTRSSSDRSPLATSPIPLITPAPIPHATVESSATE